MTTQETIGERLRAARLERKMSLRHLAQEVGVSASLISQVETGKTRPSVATLVSLANLLGISIDEVLGLEVDHQGEDEYTDLRTLGPEIQRAAENPTIEMENGVRWERLAMGRNSPAEAMVVTYEPGATSSVEGKLMRHTGIEYAYIIEGVLTFQLEFETYQLERGDSLRFNSARPHMFSNLGDVPARGVWFTLGRHSAEVLPRGRGSVAGALRHADGP
ncbi:helix-turn-helix domain-containing protein [Microbacterium sp. SYP-A9085]|uniref:helix-turn-helix domain-containing protein n=1 Tax=Microbacterium sp. SYP-A9085 TaxID=2664454 RepID=UPI00129BF6F0|nr:helix-turn-helix domain-containing protein [Microbacterium sp. SYP-A9085]MRH29876.1 helix-turn-helix domain-containing protein [Microbacterium sp. SYP-A9085]